MAVTSVTLEKAGCSGVLTADYESTSVQETFLVELDAQSRNIPDIATQCAVLAPTIFPWLGESWKVAPLYGLFAKQFQFTPYSDLLKRWKCTVSYLPLKKGEPNKDNNTGNPLAWPATYWLEWVEYEIAITQAKNVEAWAGPAARAPFTYGPVTNTAGQEFESGLFDTVRDAVICVKKNVATLDEVVARNANYALTTNSDTVLGAGPRRMKFLGADSGGLQIANEVSYYEMVTKIQVTKTTDRTVNNVGWKAYDNAGNLTNIKVPKAGAKKNASGEYDAKDLEDTPEPLFLGNDGKKKLTGTQQITFRYLEEKQYSGLLG